MLSNPLVSIIIPVYNTADYLIQSINSCINQSLQNIEIIIINDGSTDDSEKIINEYAKKDSRIKSVHKKNEGVTSARKLGFEISSGAYLFFLDSDDYLELHAIENLFNLAIEKNYDYIVGDFVWEFPNGGKKYSNFRIKEVTNHIQMLSYCYKEGDFYFTGRLFKRNLLLRADIHVPKEITSGEDNVAITQLSSYITKAGKYEGLVLHYVQRPASVTNSRSLIHLKTRDIAIKYCKNYLEKNNYLHLINDEFNAYILYELRIRILYKYIDPFYLPYLKVPFNTNKVIRNSLDSKSILNRLFLNIARINPKLAMHACSLKEKMNPFLRIILHR